MQIERDRCLSLERYLKSLLLFLLKLFTLMAITTN